MDVVYETVKVALDLHGWKVPGNPKVTVHLSEPDENGTAVMTIEGSAHASEESVIAALGILPQPAIQKYTPSTVGHVVNEPGRPPSARAAQATTKSRGRLEQPKKASRRPPRQADLVEANVGEPRQPS